MHSKLVSFSAFCSSISESPFLVCFQSAKTWGSKERDGEVPEKSQGIRVKMRVDSILAAHTGLPDGALASEGRIALSRQNCACKRTGGGIALQRLRMPKRKS